MQDRRIRRRHAFMKRYISPMAGSRHHVVFNRERRFANGYSLPRAIHLTSILQRHGGDTRNAGQQLQVPSSTGSSDRGVE